MTMANLQKLNPTQQELYNYLEQQTGQVNFEVLQPFTTQEMGAVLHISCLIERLVKKEEIKSYRDLERFCEEHRDFVALARRCFANIAEQYRINLPDSEIGYIYDYISHDYSDESPWKNEF